MRTPRFHQIAIKLCLVFLLAAALLAGQAPAGRAASAILRVKPGGRSSLPCGGSWSRACNLQYALTTAAKATDQLWVAAGTYKPGPSGARTASFQLKEGVAVYGGFAGNETALGQRDWVTNLVTLSGDLDRDGLDDHDSYHVVKGADHATLDGVTVTGGNANGIEQDLSTYGGGMLNVNTSPTLRQVTFHGNSARDGGGMWNGAGSPVLTDVTFSGNSADGIGGGMGTNAVARY
jgi:hypothetical protein